MIIFPMHKAGSNEQDRCYHTGAVYTTGPDGERLLVGVDYEAGSVAAVIRLAVLNAEVRKMRASLRRSLSLRSSEQGVGI